MLTMKKPMNHYYNETEAAHSLCITLPALHQLLDKHVFNLDHPRPAVLDFSRAELLLLSVWAEPERGKVLAMPSKN